MFKKANLPLIFSSVALVASVGVLYHERKYANDLKHAVALLEKINDVIDFSEIVRDF